MKKRGKQLLLALVSLLLLAGWGQKKVELLSDKKLIDLSAAIGKCTLGADDMTPDDGTNSQNPGEQGTPNPSAVPTPTAKVTPKPSVTPGSVSTHGPTVQPKPTADIKPRILDISVRDEQVTYRIKTWTDFDALRTQLQNDHDGRTTFCLIDDYAEAHVYRRLLELLSGLEAEIGLRYITK